MANPSPNKRDELSEIAQLTNQAQQQESQISTYQRDRNYAIVEQDQGLQMSYRNNATIERLLSKPAMMGSQLKPAVLTRLDVKEGKEYSFDFEEKLIEREKEYLNSHSANLMDDLNRKTAELMVLRQEYTSTNVQFEIELKQKNDELRNRNAKISQLTQTNQLLRNQNEENFLKLRDQVNASARLMGHYENEIDSKTKLAVLYEAQSVDCQAQTNELTAAVKELQRMLYETCDECGALETKLKEIEEQHQIDLAAKNELIADIKQELQLANDLLKMAEVENAEQVLENSVPSASVDNSRLTLIEAYKRFKNVLQKFQKKDDECNQLKMETESINMELKVKASEIERHRIDYEMTVAVNEELSQRIQTYVTQKVEICEELQETRLQCAYLEQENVKLKSERDDLATQVCHLLAKTEASRMTSDQNHSVSADMLANVVIPTTLVTFNNIVEMQENNQKLLLLVRDLSKKLEEKEEFLNSIEVKIDAKIWDYEKRLQVTEQSRRANEDLLSNCLMQKERFIQCYYEIMKDFCEPLTGGSCLIGEHMEGKDDDLVSIRGAKASQSAFNEVKDKIFSEIEQTLQAKKIEFKDLKEEYKGYRKEASGNIKLLNEEVNALRNEVRELTVANFNLTTQVNFTSEQMKSQQENVTMYEKQIETLEEHNQTCDKTVGKYEITYKYLKDEVTNTTKKLSIAEKLQHECCRLVDVKKILEVEHQSLNCINLPNSNLQNNLQMMNGSFERLESRTRLEQRLDDTYRECSALSRRLQEEQDHFREEMNAMEQLKEDAVKKMLEEQAQAETLRANLIQAEEQIQTQNQKINDLTRIEQSLMAFKFDNPVVDTNNKIKDLELQLKNKISETEKVAKQIIRTDEKEAELRKLVSRWEQEAAALKPNFDKINTKMTVDLQASRLNETKLRLQVEELQTKIRFHTADTNSESIDTISENKAPNNLKEALMKLSAKDEELRDLLLESHKLKEDSQTIEHKYSNESLDLQAPILCKDELNKCQERTDQLEAANVSLKTSRLECKKLDSEAVDERLQLEKKLECLDKQNRNLRNIALHFKHVVNSFIASSFIKDCQQQASSSNTVTVQTISGKRSGNATDLTRESFVSPQNKRIHLDEKTIFKSVSESSVSSGELFGQDEGHAIDEDSNDTNEIDVDGSSDAPNQSSSGIETRQIQIISSGSDTGSAGQESTWWQVQSPTRQQKLISSTPILYVPRRANNLNETPHRIVPHAPYFTYNGYDLSSADRTYTATLDSATEGRDDTSMNLNLLDESVDSSFTISDVHDSDNYQIVNVDLVDESYNTSKKAHEKEPVVGPGDSAAATYAKYELNAMDDSTSIVQLTDDQSVSIEVDVDNEDVETGGVSFEGETSSGQEVEEHREAEASIQMVLIHNAQSRNTRSIHFIVENQHHPTSIDWDEAY